MVKIFTWLIAVLLFLTNINCNSSARKRTGKVHVQKENGGYTLYKNGKPYFIKGVAGFTHLKKLSEIGGNTIKIYDTVNLAAILDSAYANHIAVVVGIPIPQSRYAEYFYDDPLKVSTEFNAIKKTVEKYKGHPALLMWCLGNEVQFGFKLKYKNFYKAFNNLVDMIHTEDADHPITTSVINFDIRGIFNIVNRTNIDIISFNIFGPIKTFKQNLKTYSWMWNGPFLIAEWGASGPWEAYNKTSWSVAIEPTSSKKIQQYYEVYKNYLPIGDPRFLGSFIFYWGQKQEVTPTWFSFFSENAYASETVGMLQEVWTGKPPAHPAPRVKYMLVDKKGANDNIIYKPNTNATAVVYLDSTDNRDLSIKWEVLPEDWVTKDYNKNTKKLNPVKGSIIASNGLEATFITPAKEGPYRIYAFIYDKYGNFATCNTPFYIIKE